ncbi:MAG: BolA family transcriptional regulator [Alphaproteobacteria bacterium]|nr:BolA family transcriptional regulator [Alphaproteobacteria bacterium]MDX5368238.1 BolA family transcriptional regulator [Alphaproteobacteria bacterium]MDX5463047.1 BolA family transcriptional regulator [Alphaproteobacteria bacterium]
MSVAERLKRKLEAAFPPAQVDVTDESHLHAGHAGARPEGETHFRVRIVSPAFAGQSRVARQRAIHKAVGEELAGPVHAFAVKALTPEEAAG